MNHTNSLKGNNQQRTRTTRRRFLITLGVLLLSLSALALTGLALNADTTLASPQLPADSKIDPLLQEIMQRADRDDQLRVIIRMRDAVAPSLADLPEDVIERRTAIVQRLSSNASRSQSDIQRELHNLEDQNQVTYSRSLWIINSLQIVANVDAINALASREDVSQITLDAKVQLVRPLTITGMTESSAPSEAPWGLQRSRVQHVWAGLGITGTGVTIAIMDTGTDWLHPALKGTYRGALGPGPVSHKASWFDAVKGVNEPFDPHGHGTHVAGTATGANGIGVAPGSNWIATRVLDRYGFGYIGNIHAGFQWLLAPGGDPALAPDIVNGSWAGHPELADFMPDVEALHAAGIITVFAAGNTGPYRASIVSPANYPNTVAVGASNDIDEAAWFSSRGPAAWTAEVKPTLLAPGMQILSALPGGHYGFASGTSMAAPHIAGAHALVMSARPDLTPSEVTAVLTATAFSAGVGHPNYDIGWGRVDAYAAVSSVSSSGRIRGDVRSEGTPLAGAVVTITTPGGAGLSFLAAANGLFAADLLPGVYAVEVSTFGYESYSNGAVPVALGKNTRLSIDLPRLPYGIVSGRLLDRASRQPIAGSVRLLDSPLTFPVAEDGRFEVELPVGDYQLVGWALGHRLDRRAVNISAGVTIKRDFILRRGPRILLVDSGRWYLGSTSQYYETALQDNDYAYSLLSVRDPITNSIDADLLGQYSVLVWSSPQDSPGAVGVGDALAEYLDAGGKLLVSGQNVASYDHVQQRFQYWWYEQLRGRYLGKAEPPLVLKGASGSAFEAFELSLEESDSDGNLTQPDATQPLPGTLTEVAFTYPNGEAAGLLADRCEPFRIAYLGFGLESVSGPDTRAELLERSMAFFRQPEAEAGVAFDKPMISDLVPPGGHRSYRFQLINLSQTLTDTFKLELADAAWPTTIVTDTVTIGPCQAAATQIEVDIPGGLPAGTIKEFRIAVSSTNDQNYENDLRIQLKVPGHLLLVDDDRWYDQASTYKAALDSAGFDYDFWEIGYDDRGSGSPELDLLAAYDFVVWYTGYDWFRPITDEESDALLAYLEQGGRLFLTSQDYLYYHDPDDLTRQYFGVQGYSESVTPTLVYGGSTSTPFAELAGPLALEYGPYRNFSDGIVPSFGSEVSLWNDQGSASGVARAGSGWRTVFWALPFETLPVETHGKAMNRVLGWLGDLGDSSFQVDRRSGLPGETRAYSLTLRYSPVGPGSLVEVKNSIPVSLTIDEASLTGDATYDPSQRLLSWQGFLGPGQQHQLTYRATTSGLLAPGARLDNSVQIRYEDHDLNFERTASTWMASPDLSSSELRVSPGPIGANRPVTLELAVNNLGPVSGTVTATLTLPKSVPPDRSSVSASKGETELADHVVTWKGTLLSSETALVTVSLTSPQSILPTWLTSVAIIEDGVTHPVIKEATFLAKPLNTFFPVLQP